MDTSITRGGSISVETQQNSSVPNPRRQYCICSPTTHPGSFRCNLHKIRMTSHHQRLNMRRWAITNSHITINGGKGQFIKSAVAALIRPSSHNQRRTQNFKSRPSRFSIL